MVQPGRPPGPRRRRQQFVGLRRIELRRRASPDGDAALDQRVEAFVDHAHRALAQLTADLVLLRRDRGGMRRWRCGGLSVPGIFAQNRPARHIGMTFAPSGHGMSAARVMRKATTSPPCRMRSWPLGACGGRMGRRSAGHPAGHQGLTRLARSTGGACFKVRKDIGRWTRSRRRPAGAIQPRRPRIVVHSDVHDVGLGGADGRGHPPARPCRCAHARSPRSRRCAWASARPDLQPPLRVTLGCAACRCGRPCVHHSGLRRGPGSRRCRRRDRPTAGKPSDRGAFAAVDLHRRLCVGAESS